MPMFDGIRPKRWKDRTHSSAMWGVFSIRNMALLAETIRSRVAWKRAIGSVRLFKVANMTKTLDQWLMERRGLVDHAKTNGFVDRGLCDLDVALRIIEAALKAVPVPMMNSQTMRKAMQKALGIELELEAEKDMQAVLDGEGKHGNST